MRILTLTMFFVDWWFTEPLHPVEEPPPEKDEALLPWACTNCNRRFHEVVHILAHRWRCWR